MEQKTTLLRMISGIMTPSSGTITIDNLNYKDNELEIKKRISFLTEIPNYIKIYQLMNYLLCVVNTMV